MGTTELILYDRSRVVTDWTCPRKRYLNYELLGQGIAPATTSLELYLGSAVHDGLAAIAHMQKDGVPASIDEIETVAKQQMMAALSPRNIGEVDELEFANEQATLVAGLLRGFYQYVWPKLMQQYPEIVCIEQEMHYDHDGLRFMSRPDLVLRDREGQIWYIEYKTTSSKKDSWIHSWETAVQLHSSIRAIEETLHEKVTGVIVQGLYKGYESYGKQSSPFCYGYRRNGNPPFTETETVYEYRAGFKRTPTWEYPGGVRAWVASMPENVLSNQFPCTPPIFVKDDLINAFFEQRKFREHEIKLAKDMIAISDEESAKGILNVAFPQRFDQCYPGWGSPCQFRMICHSHVADPLTQGFTLRSAHHTEEAEQLGQTI